MKANSLTRGALILAAAGVVVKILGALFRIPLTNILGAEGMGLYQLVIPVYALFLAFATSGVPTALSRLVAERISLGRSTRGVTLCAVIFVGVISVATSALLAGLSSQFAALTGNDGAALGFLTISPALIAVGGLAVLRGSFQGYFNMVPTAVSNIIEQTLRLALGLGLAVAFLPRGVIYGVVGALIGVVASEFGAVAYMLLHYAVFVRKNKVKLPPYHFHRTEFKGDFAAFLRVTLPIAATAVLLPVSGFADSFLVVNMLKLRSMTTSAATGQYGLLLGPVNSLINMPIVILLSLAVAVVPSMSADRTGRDIDSILKKSTISLKLTYLIGVPFALFFIVYARPLTAALYPALSQTEITTAANLLALMSLNVIFMSSMQVHGALLQALGDTSSPLFNTSLAVAIKILLTAVLTRYFGIVGCAAATLSMGATAYVLNSLSLSKLLGKNVKLYKNVSLILLGSVIMALISLPPRLTIGNPIACTAVGGCVCVIAYVLLIAALKIFDDSEMSDLPLGGLFLRFSKKVRFWEDRR